MTAFFTRDLALALLSELMITFPFHLFAYIPFWQHLRLDKKKMPLFLALIQAAYMLIYLALYSVKIPVNLIHLTALFIYGIPFFTVVDMEKGKIAFFFVFTSDYIIIAHTAANSLGFLINASSEGFYSLSTGLLCLGIFLVTLPFMLRYFCRTAQNIFEIEASGIWNKVWLLPAFNSITVYLSKFSSQNNPHSITYLLPPVLLIGSMFLIYYYVIQSTHQFQEQLKSQEEIRRLEQLSALQANEYKLLQSHIKETRRARHDLRQHLRAIQGYIDNQDFLSLEDYIRKIDESIPLEVPHIWSGNPAVDAILGFYAQKAMDAGIDMEISVHMSENTIIPEHELCVLIGNLLENAMDACSASFPQKSILRIHIHQTGNSMLTLTVDNSCTAPPVTDSGTLLSSKHPGSGIGTESVRVIAKRYHGDARFEWRDGIFYVSVLLNP